MEITKYLIECIENNIPFSFSKYGDGEYACIFGEIGHNCDNDQYTLKLSQKLCDSLIYMVNNGKNYIGQWNFTNCKRLQSLIPNKPINFVDYHSLIFLGEKDEEKAKLYKTIKYSPLKKIIVCNPLLIKSKSLLNIDDIVLIPFNNWFDNFFDVVLNNIINIIKTDGNHIVMTCCGMSAKVLICELYKKFPKGIYLDFGSALDKICTKRESRGWPYTYDYLTLLLKECIPTDWEDIRYNELYLEAQSKLGRHLN